MKIPRSILKVAAVCSSLLLGGGLIAYKSGALPWAKPEQLDEAMSGSKSYRFSGLDAVGSTVEPAPVLLPGSKRGDVFIVPELVNSTPREMIVLPGSKSYTGMTVFNPGDLISPQPNEPVRLPFSMPTPAMSLPSTSVQSVSPSTLKIDPKEMKDLNRLPPPLLMSSSKTITLEPRMSRPLVEFVFPNLFQPVPTPFSTAIPPSK